MSIISSAAVLFLGAAKVAGHGQMVYPPSNRVKGSYSDGGNCENVFSCLWFSQPVSIPGEPVLNEEQYRTYNVKVSSGEGDWSRQHPWRAPGTAPVLGRGCGVAGGSSEVSVSTAGVTPTGVKQGLDGFFLPAQAPTTWRRGSMQEVGFGLLANHGGGYSYRLCPAGGNVTEECFLRGPLTFAGDKHFLRFADLWTGPDGTHKAKQLPDYEIPNVKWVDPATKTEWLRNPVPGCLLCDQAECMKLKDFDAQQACSQACSGMNLTHCPPNLVQFPEPLSGISGFDKLGASGWAGFPWSIVDYVNVPVAIDAGKYILSWRWDCEQSTQIWQNCADIVIE